MREMFVTPTKHKSIINRRYGTFWVGFVNLIYYPWLWGTNILAVTVRAMNRVSEIFSTHILSIQFHGKFSAEVNDILAFQIFSCNDRLKIFSKNMTISVQAKSLRICLQLKFFLHFCLKVPLPSLASKIKNAPCTVLFLGTGSAKLRTVLQTKCSYKSLWSIKLPVQSWGHLFSLKAKTDSCMKTCDL